MNENKIYLLWYEEQPNEPAKLKIFDNFDDAVREFVKLDTRKKAKLDTRKKAIIAVEPHHILYDREEFDRYINVRVISEKNIWKRAYELEKEKKGEVEK